MSLFIKQQWTHKKKSVYEKGSPPHKLVVSDKPLAAITLSGCFLWSFISLTRQLLFNNTASVYICKDSFLHSSQVLHNIPVRSRSGYRLDFCNILILFPSSFCCTFVYEFGIIVLFRHDPVQSKLQLSFRQTHISLQSFGFQWSSWPTNWLHGAQNLWLQNISKPSLLHHNDWKLIWGVRTEIWLSLNTELCIMGKHLYFGLCSWNLVVQSNAFLQT